jgi:hypothetical protein
MQSNIESEFVFYRVPHCRDQLIILCRTGILPSAASLRSGKYICLLLEMLWSKGPWTSGASKMECSEKEGAPAVLANFVILCSSQIPSFLLYILSPSMVWPIPERVLYRVYGPIWIWVAWPHGAAVGPLISSSRSCLLETCFRQPRSRESQNPAKHRLAVIFFSFFGIALL